MAVFGLKINYLVRGEQDELALQKMTVAFERTAENLDKFGQHLFPKLNKVFEDELFAQFDAQGRGPNRGRWKELSPAYSAQKEKEFPGRRILERTGTLGDALTSSSSPYALRMESGTQYNFGTQNLDYASYHQTGTGKMPDRPPFDFTPELEKNLLEAGKEAVRELIREANADRYVDVED